MFDFGTNNFGRARLDYGGDRTVVNFTATDFVSTGPNTAHIFFDWFFPEGTLEVVEHSRSRPLDESRVLFRARVDVIGGGSGGWSWYGHANRARGVAVIEHMSGEVCFG